MKKKTASYDKDIFVPVTMKQMEDGTNEYLKTHAFLPTLGPSSAMIKAMIKKGRKKKNEK